MLKKVVIIFLFSIILFPKNMFAYGLILDLEKKNFDIGEQFEVAVFVDIDNLIINGAEIKINFSEQLKFIRFDESNSVFPNWIEKNVSGNSISLSAIIPAGYQALVDGETGKKQKSEVIKVIFEATKSGDAFIKASNVNLYLNDGEGTLEVLSNATLNLYISSITSPKTIIPKNEKIKPEFRFEVIRNEDIYEGKRTLVFSASDKQSGIEGVYILNGKIWEKISSPFLLKNKGEFSIIRIRVVDNSENQLLVNIIDKKIYILAGILCAIVVILIIYVHHSKRKINKVQI